MACVEHVANINKFSPFVEVLNTAAAGNLFYFLAAQKDIPLQLWRTGGIAKVTLALSQRHWRYRKGNGAIAKAMALSQRQHTPPVTAL